LEACTGGTGLRRERREFRERRRLATRLAPCATKPQRRYGRQLEAAEIELPLKHPPFMVRDVESDRRYFGNMMQDVVMSKLKW